MYFKSKTQKEFSSQGAFPWFSSFSFFWVLINPLETLLNANDNWKESQSLCRDLRRNENEWIPVFLFLFFFSQCLCAWETYWNGKLFHPFVNLNEWVKVSVRKFEFGISAIHLASKVKRCRFRPNSEASGYQLYSDKRHENKHPLIHASSNICGGKYKKCRTEKVN